MNKTMEERIEMFLKQRLGKNYRLIKGVWKTSRSSGEYGSTHKFEDTSVPFATREPYFANKDMCVKRVINPYTFEHEIEDLSHEWNNCR